VCVLTFIGRGICRAMGELHWLGRGGNSPSGGRAANDLSYLVFMPKPCTHRMHDPGSIVPYIRPKVFTDKQLSWIKYNYYINNVSKDYDDSQVKWNNRRLHNATGTTTGATHSLELLAEEFQSTFSFWAAGLSSRGKIARLSTLMVGTPQVQEINDI
jgi:hypothetical protein